MTVGAKLKHARKESGLSLDEIAARTKVRPGILADIEADAHDRLPALTYTLGFAKAYARTVGLDPAAIAERYRQESMKGDPVPTMVDLEPLEEKRLPSARLVAMATTLILVIIGLFWAWGAGWLTPSPPREPETTAQAGAAEESGTPGPAAPAEPAASPAAPAADAPVELVAREDVWLRITDGGETFFQGILNPGQTLSLPPGRAWKLRTGRAGALEAKIGGRVTPPLGGPAQQLYDFPLDPQALAQRLAPALPPALPPTAAAGSAQARPPQG
ncbi:helix-turn-helix domain-containing protein [Sandaracinobacteroides sp. A072]|uniref:helix-turn-helix domain-containing protein n=1 Tax=Sandaracinobacteroides sp. A072 TaxID=3461146 RepID=UPI0040424D45